MAIQHQININRNPQGRPRVKFEPNSLVAGTQDQIFWTNNDSESHWPGLLNSDGSINRTFFMPDQIAPSGGASAIFSASAAVTLTYACSLHRDETGTVRFNGGSRDYPP